MHQPETVSTTAPRERPLRRPIQVFLGALAIVLLVVGLLAFRTIVLLALIGVLLGVLPEPLIRVLKHRLRIPHGLSVMLLAIVVLGATAALGYAIYASLAPQVERLAEQAPAIWEKLDQQVNTWFARFPWLNGGSQQLDVGGLAQQAAEMITKTVRVGVGGLAAIVVLFMIAIFVAVNLEEYGRGMLSLFPPAMRGRVSTLARGSTQVVRRWFVGQVLVVMISGTMTAVAMLVIGIDYWLLIAALTVVLNFIPYLGAVITGAIAALLTLGTEPDKIWWVLLAYVLIQQIESDVILPIVMKGTVRLPEAHLLVFVLLMGVAFGITGIFVAPPLFAVLHHLFHHAYVPWIERER